jgi:hypothetical protein
MDPFPATQPFGFGGYEKSVRVDLSQRVAPTANGRYRRIVLKN